MARDRYDSDAARRDPVMHDRWRIRIQDEIASDILVAAVRDHVAGIRDGFSRAVLVEFYRAYTTGVGDERIRSTRDATFRELGRGLLTFVRDYERELRAGTTALPPVAAPAARKRPALYGG